MGGEVDNPKWKAQWDGKKIYPEDSMDPEVHLKKGGVNPSSPDAKYQVDALSGATLTSNGVTNLLQFWMGENGFAKYLTQFRDVKGA
ncbi:FMN-binding protein [Cobetia marina]